MSKSSYSNFLGALSDLRDLLSFFSSFSYFLLFPLLEDINDFFMSFMVNILSTLSKSIGVGGASSFLTDELPFFEIAPTFFLAYDGRFVMCVLACNILN